MDNNKALIIKKMIQKALINELERVDLITFSNTTNIIKKLDEDISKLKELQKNNQDKKNIIIKVPI